jgi:transposase-like protein
MSKRANKESLRALAEQMFVESGMTAKAIASNIGVTQQTISRWRKGQGDTPISWDDKRKNFLATPHNIKKVLMQELTRVTEGHDPDINVKALAEISKVIESLSDKVSVQIVFTVFKEFDNWMSEQDPEIAVSFTEWHKLFLLHKAQQEN